MATAPLVDAHCHLNDTQFASDWEAVAERARAAGVVAMVVAGYDLASSERAVAMAARSPGVWATVGIHPHDAAAAGAGAFRQLRKLCGRAGVVAVGETGLDYHYRHSPPEVQQEALRHHVRLARETGLPLVVHNREADADLLRILREEGAAEVGGMLHCFWSGPDTAAAALELGFYLSLGGPLTFPRNEELRAVVARLPLERLLVETDAPYLAPVPYRGRRNEPAFVVETARRLAAVLGRPLDEVAAQTTLNARRLLRMPAPG